MGIQCILSVSLHQLSRLLFEFSIHLAVHSLPPPGEECVMRVRVTELVEPVLVL